MNWLLKLNPLFHLFGWHLRPAKRPKTLYDSVQRDDGSWLAFDRPLNLGQALSAKSREQR